MKYELQMFKDGRHVETKYHETYKLAYSFGKAWADREPGRTFVVKDFIKIPRYWSERLGRYVTIP